MNNQETMTSKERVLNALNMNPVDRTPVANPTRVATVELMDLGDAPFPAACRDPELVARLAATEYTELGFDCVTPYFSIIQESSALGCDIQWEDKDNWPTVRMNNPIWKSSSDVKVPSDFLEHRDIKAITESIRILRQELGNDVAIIGKTMGPWTLAYHVFGVESFLLGTVDDPNETMKCLEKLTEISATDRWRTQLSLSYSFSENFRGEGLIRIENNDNRLTDKTRKSRELRLSGTFYLR